VLVFMNCGGIARAVVLRRNVGKRNVVRMRRRDFVILVEIFILGRPFFLLRLRAERDFWEAFFRRGHLSSRFGEL